MTTLHAPESIKAVRVFSRDGLHNGGRARRERAAWAKWLVAANVYVFQDVQSIRQAFRRAFDLFYPSESYLNLLTFRRRLARLLEHNFGNIFRIFRKFTVDVRHKFPSPDEREH